MDNDTKKSKLMRWLPVLIIAALMVTAYFSGFHEYLTLEKFQGQKNVLQEYVSAHPFISALGFIGLYIVTVALSLPFATLLTLSGGFLFGSIFGTLYVVGAATIGAAIVFTIAKTSLGQTLREKAGSLYSRVEKNMDENAVGYLLFMRLVPVFPFVLVNIVPALFNVKLRTFILTTFFGILPGSFVYVNLGSQLGEIKSLSDLASPQTFIAFALLGLFALIPTLYKQFKARKAAAACVLLLSITAPNIANANDFLTLYDDLLAAYTAPTQKNGISYIGVDYDAWAKDKNHATALAALMQIKTHDKAFWINAYNFLTIDLITREGEKDSIKNLGSFFQNPWKRYNWDIGGKSYTLDYIEHKILRPTGDARVHFAINCASVSCPDLRQESYRSKTLDAQLDDQTKLAFKNTKKIFNETDKNIQISKIFSWFKEDFDEGDIKKWMSRYKDFGQRKTISYMTYDWSLNKVK